MLQRLADFSDQKHESGLYEVCAGDSSHHTQSRTVDDRRLVRGLVGSFDGLRANAQSVLWPAFAWLIGVTPDREAHVDWTDIVDFGDQIWHLHKASRP